MTSSKSTKRALISSTLAILMCVAMLIGTTFAWFTDTASTAVNKIQAGNLKVDLEMHEGTDWVSAEGKTLSFKKAAGHENEQILWEPGCTYELPQLRVVNKGNLALKYKVVFSAINGDEDAMKLAEVLDVSLNGTKVGTLKDALTSTDPDGFAHGNLPAEGTSGELKIPVQMQTTAGNDYQGLSIGGIAVTLLATQDTVENDSYSNQYDENATYPDVMFVGGDNAAEVKEELKDALTADKEEIIVSLTSDVTYDVAAWSGNAMGGDSTKTITINGNGHKILFNNTNSDWNNIVTGDAKLVINNAIVDNSGYNADGGTWNGHDITFLNDVEFNKVTFTNAVAVTANAVFNNCSISDVNSTSDAYMLWIRAGANVKIDGLNINGKNANTSINNRAIKIADQYIDDPAMTYLSVKNATISSEKKAAILVTSTAGANIELENVNISNVAADSTNAVWKDNGSDAWKNAPVTVNGGTCIVEP